MHRSMLPTAITPGFVNLRTGRHVIPGTVIGHRKDGRPIYAIAGGSGEGDTDGDGSPDGDQDGSPSQDGDSSKKPDIKGDYDPERAARAIAAAREGEKKAKADAKAEKERVAAILKAAGLTPDGKTDPAEQLKAAAEERDKAQQKLRDKSLRLSVRENADKAGVEPTATLDSTAFRAAVAELDPDAADYDDQVTAAMKVALKANPRLAAAQDGQGPARQGADHSGGSNGRQRPASLGAAIAARMGGQ